MSPPGPKETRLNKGLTTPPTPATQAALLDEDLEQEEEAEFEAFQKIIIVFTAYERGHKTN